MAEKALPIPSNEEAPAAKFEGKQDKKGKKWKGKKDAPIPTPGPANPSRPVSRTLPAPSLKSANQQSTNKTVTNESLISESVFATDNALQARHREIEFEASATGWTDVVDLTYAELRNDKSVQVTKELPIEALRYYASCVYWLRVIALKNQLGQDLTQTEDRIMTVFEGKTLVLPDPIHMGLKAIGRVTTKNGEVLAPRQPTTPTTVTANTPGTLGVVDRDNCLIYTDHPIVGIAYQGAYERAQDVVRATYVSAVAPRNTTANRNLQGFAPLAPVRQDCIGILNSMGFDVNTRPPSIGNSGINYNAVKTVSNFLARTTTFRLVETDVFAIPPVGSLAQIIASVPTDATVAEITRASASDVTMQCYAQSTTTQIGITEVYGLCTYKGTSVARPWQSWSPITWTAQVPIPDELVENRNERRNLPARFFDRVFYSAIHNLEDQRKTVVSRMANHRT